MAFLSDASAHAAQTAQTADAVHAALAAVADPHLAVGAARFFQTGPGQYGEGDVFLGVRVPQVRQIIKAFRALPFGEIDALLASPIHDLRLAGLLILVGQYRAKGSHRAELVEFYLTAVRRGQVNNWDLVDCSAPSILGDYLWDQPRDVLTELAASTVLWQRRVAIIATLGLIMRGDATTTLQLAPTLLTDREPLMHKAVGWMLREVGKRVDRSLLLAFLDDYAARMPRTALSYATEHLTPEQRAHYRALRV